MSTPAQLDDNMVPGQTYTFQLSLDNLITHPSTSTIQADLQASAPSFVGNDLTITTPPTANPFSNIYNVEFTYNGDGSDVISDVANTIVATIKQISNDNFTFQSAYADSAGNVSPGGIGDVIKQALDQATTAAGDVLDKAAKKTGDAAQNLLTPVEIAVAILFGLVVLFIFTSGKAGGFSASESGVKVGGR